VLPNRWATPVALASSHVKRKPARLGVSKQPLEPSSFHNTRARAVAINANRQFARARVAGMERGPRQGDDRPVAHVKRNAIQPSPGAHRVPSGEAFTAPPVEPVSPRQIHFALALPQKKRRHQKGIAAQPRIVHAARLDITGIIESKGAKGRRAFIVVARERRVQVGHELHSQFEPEATERLGFAPVGGKRVGVVEIGLRLLPGRVADIPGVDKRLRGKHRALHAAHQIFGVLRVAHFGRPEQTAKTGRGQSAHKSAVVVKVAVKRKGMRRGERTGRAHRPISAPPTCLEGFFNR